jgi:hypothetical protein
MVRELWRSTDGGGGGVVWRGCFSTPILYSRGGRADLILRMGVAGDEGGMNVSLLCFGCRGLRISDGWESTRTSAVEASAREVRCLDGGEVASHPRLPARAASGDLPNRDDKEGIDVASVHVERRIC